MRIEGARLSFAVTHQEARGASKAVSVRAWIGSPPGGAPPAGSSPPATYPRPPKTAPVSPPSEETTGEDPKLMLARLMIEALTGRKIRLLSSPDPQSSREPPQLPAVGQAAPSSTQTPAVQGWGVDIRTTEVQQEAERTVVAAEGIVRTADGREIAVSVELSMARERREETQTRLQLGDAARVQDPLVVNFGDGGVQLEPLRFAFDLNADGRDETVPLLGAGSGFLALDRNANGTIDDGRELFGPHSGDGYAELADLDGDGNGWIDEGDAAYGELRIWVRDASGAHSLLGLADRGVGALSLAHAESPFALKDAAHDLQGQVRATGIYLREDGSAGTTQQVDLVA